MKSFITRPALLLALALGLAGCGGKAKFTVGGTVTGLQYPGLTLINGGETLAVSPAAGATAATVINYSFPKQIDYGEAYNVGFGSLPAHQTCSYGTLARPSDTAGRLASIDIPIVCSLIVKSVVVTVTGAPTGLVLTNGSSGTATVTATDATTTTSFGVPYGNSYGITVLTQPTDGKTCTVSNGVGVMGDDDITDTVTVACV